MILKFFYKLYVIYKLIILYGYLYLTPLFNYFYKTPDKMKQKCFLNYITKVKLTTIEINLYDKIIIEVDNIITQEDNINLKKEMNLYLMNHNSILDNMILAKILEETFSWNDLRTVSGISSRKIQNRTLELHQMLLVKKDLKHDLEALGNILNKWKNSKDCIQIILFPEGTIFLNQDLKLNNMKKKFFSKILKKNNFYNNTLLPNIGIYNLLTAQLKNDIKNIYDISVVYTLNGKRITGELNILDAIYDKEFRIDVKIKEYPIKEALDDPYWLFKLWDKKDDWISSKIKVD
jgi:hypothetical protein